MTLVAVWMAAAWPCAGMVAEDAEVATSPEQQVAYFIDGESVEAVYRVTWEGSAESFGWIIPVPGPVDEVADGEEQLFTDLLSLTNPTYSYYEEDNSVGCLLGAGSDKNDAGGRGGDTGFSPSDGVDVEDEGFTGSYAYQVLTAESEDALVSWLDEHGFGLGPAEDTIGDYVTEEGRFVVIELAQTLGGGSETRVLPPVSISYTGEASYPAKMGLGALPDTMRTTLWVLGKEHYQVRDWNQTTIEDIDGTVDDDPTGLFEEALYDATGDERRYARTWVGHDYDYAWSSDERLYITRFDTWADTELHTLDVTFGEDSSALEGGVHITLYEELPSEAWLLLLPLPLMLLRRRR